MGDADKKVPLKCVISGCDARGLPEDGYDFFVCGEHLNRLAAYWDDCCAHVHSRSAE